LYKRAHSFANIFISFPKPQSFSTRRLYVKQRSSLVKPTIVTKLQFIAIKQKFFYIDKQRPTSFNKTDTWVNNTTMSLFVHSVN